MNETNIRKTANSRSRKGQKAPAKLSPELLEFLNSPLSTAEIARRYDISQATLTVRAKKAGLPLRKRGRWPASEPTARQKNILRCAAIHGCQAAALQFELSKQRVNKLQHRWKAWVAMNDQYAPKASTRRNMNRYTIRFRLDPDGFKQLTKLLQHPWFRQLRSPNEAAQEIVNTFLSGEMRSLRSNRVVTR